MDIDDFFLNRERQHVLDHSQSSIDRRSFDGLRSLLNKVMSVRPTEIFYPDTAHDRDNRLQRLFLEIRASVVNLAVLIQINLRNLFYGPLLLGPAVQFLL